MEGMAARLAPAGRGGKAKGIGGASSPALPLSSCTLLPETALKQPRWHQPGPSAPPGSGPASAGVPLGSLGCGSLARITASQF